MLEVKNLSKLYSSIPAVDNVSFRAGPGEITGYLGANGSGKSTTMKIITGLIRPTKGEVFYNNSSIHDDLMAFRRILGYVPEEPHLYTHLSGMEYLDMVAALRGLEKRSSGKRIAGMLRLLGLYGDRDVAIASYSKGMRQKVLLIAALMHNPEVVLLDEPFSGLDVGSSLILRSLMQQLAGQNKVVLFSSHELETVERLCEHVIILHKSRLVADDSISNLRTLMDSPTLEGIFSQLAVEVKAEDVAAELASLIAH